MTIKLRGGVWGLTLDAVLALVLRHLHLLVHLGPRSFLAQLKQHLVRDVVSRERRVFNDRDKTTATATAWRLGGL